MVTGVMLTRAQPFHKGHMDVVNQILKENERCLIVIGSANKCNTERNPLMITDRTRMITHVLKWHNLTQSTVQLLPLCDWSMENAYQYAQEWGNFLYYNIVNAIQQKEFAFYYNDDPETVKRWFNPDISKRVTVRSSVRVRDVSGTKIRDAILSHNEEYLKKCWIRRFLKNLITFALCYKIQINLTIFYLKSARGNFHEDISSC